MSKIAIASDLHLNNNPYGKILDDGLPLKIHDNFAAFDFLVSKCIELKVSRLMIIGDAFENPSPTSKVRRMFDHGLQKLLDKGIEIVILTGNHDSCKEHHALEPLKGWNKKLKVVDTASVEKVKDVNFVYIPHTNEIESRTATFKEYISKLNGKFDTSKDRYILFGHFGVFGAMKNDYVRNVERDDVAFEDLDNLKFEACFLGHYHRRQNLSKDGNVWYVGSTERRDFSEKDQIKGFCVYDLDTKEIEWVDYEARKMVEIYGKTYDDIVALIEGGQDLSDSIVKIKVLGGDEEYANIQQKFFDLNTLLKSKDIAFFSGLEKKLEAQEKDVFPDIQIEFKDGVDVFNVVETELLRISELESKEEIQSRLALLKEIQDEVNSVSRFAVSPAMSGKRTIRFKWAKYHNFCRFGEKDNVLDFDKLFHNSSGDMAGIASIVGMVDANENEANGAGKSTILEGIAYALYEKVPRLSSVKNRDKKTTTEIVRTNDQGEYACRESFVELCIEVDGSEWVIKRGRKLGKTGNHTPILDITKDGQTFNSIKTKEPNQIILDLIGMDFEPFCNSVFFAQKDTNKIFTLTQKGKIDTVLNVLGILRDVDEALDIIRNSKKKQAKEKCLALEGKISALESSVVGNEFDLQTKLESTKKLIDELEQLSKTSNESIEKLSVEKTNKNTIQQSNFDIRSKLEESIRILSIKKTEEKQFSVSEKARLLEEMRKEKSKDEEFLKNKEKLRAEYEKETAVISSINISDLKEKLVKIEEAKTKINSVKLEKKNCVSSRSVLIESRSGLSGGVATIEESMEKYLEVLKEADGDNVLCPYCKSIKSKEHILGEIRSLVKKRDGVGIQIKSLSLKILEKDKEESEIESRETDLQNLIVSEGRVFKGIYSYETANKNLSGIADRAKALKQSYGVSKGIDVVVLQEQINKLEESSRLIDEKFAEEEKKIRNDFTGIENVIISVQKEILSIDKEISKLKIVILNSNDSSKASYGEYKTLELKLSILKQARTNLDLARKELEEQRLIQTRVSVLEELFGSDGIRTKIADIYVPIFNRHLTDFVTILTAGRMHVQLEQGTLEPKITGASSSNYEMLSGGEQDVIRLAANLALGMVSLGSSRSLPETLFLDEVFGSLAPAMQDRVFDLLRHLRGYFSRILVITHNPMLQERFDRVVCVEKIGGISQITLGNFS